MRVATDRRLVALGADFEHVCALDAEGALLCWGQDGQLGKLGRGAGVDQPLPQVVPGVPPLVSLSVGARSSCAIDAEGALWCWGWDDLGLVTGEPGVVDRPTAVPGLR